MLAVPRPSWEALAGLWLQLAPLQRKAVAKVAHRVAATLITRRQQRPLQVRLRGLLGGVMPLQQAARQPRATATRHGATGHEGQLEAADVLVQVGMCQAPTAASATRT